MLSVHTLLVPPPLSLMGLSWPEACPQPAPTELILTEYNPQSQGWAAPPGRQQPARAGAQERLGELIRPRACLATVVSLGLHTGRNIPTSINTFPRLPTHPRT